MSELIAIAFDQKHQADEVMLSLLKLEEAHLIDLEDATVITKNSAGKIRLKPYYDLLAACNGLSSRFWGKLIYMLLLDGNNSGLAEIGIDRAFVEKIEANMSPDTSAIFIFVNRADPDLVVKTLAQFKGKILQTTLSKKDRGQLEAAIS
ncbi:MAG: DUF1269 domain-containing protein [Prochloraceae cyanobacterium]|nr:DUF1269 domain-containing protein [Prochloraceae cyanobacterium]